MKTLNKLEVIVVCFNDVHDLSMYAHQRKRPNNYLTWLSHKLIGNWDYEYLGIQFLERGKVRVADIGKRTPSTLTAFSKFLEKIEDQNFSKFVKLGQINMEIEDPIILPSDIQRLHLYEFKCGRPSFNHIFGLGDVIGLKECIINDCNGLKSIFSSWCASFKTLEVLLLRSLMNLEVIVGESIQPEPGTFSNLKVIHICGCEKLKNLFSAKWVLQDLHNLTEIEVEYCEEMEEIIASEKEGKSTKTEKEGKSAKTGKGGKSTKTMSYLLFPN
ncbi:hypothetical protein QUC31_002110 [Theobroma cacao]